MIETLHVGILGGGNISETHARAVGEIPGLRVAAIAGHNAGRAQALAARHGAVAYSETDALLRHRPLDLVLIGSPSGLHAEQGIAAARAGLHVLTEKPIDVSTGWPCWIRTPFLTLSSSKSPYKLKVCPP